MHNLYVPPYKIFLFLVLFGFGFFSASLLKDDQTTLPKFDVPKPDFSFDFKFDFNLSKPEIDEEIAKPTKLWNDVVVQTNGTDRKYGNLVGIQLVLQPEDFVKEEWWRERIEETLIKGKSSGIFDRKTIVILPEHLGTGLLFLDEKSRFLNADSLELALKTKGENFSLSDLLYLKAEKMAEVYVRTFSELAKQYNVPILAGTIVLPNPKIVKGSLVIDPKGPLYNVAIPFSADGKLMDPIVKKTILTEEELKILSPGENTQDRVWVVPGWKVAILIGQEVFDNNIYNRLVGKPIDGLISPSASYPEMKWQSFDLEDPNVWKQEGMAKNIKSTKAQDLVQVFLTGHLYGKKWNGKTFNLRDFSNEDQVRSVETPTILNLYF
ncbi:hydrolase, carbon-nitrogen family protein [Leptospira sp. 2 VSF19]|uniref:Hydrolase, carbon-nitrogen family protein n=1 Tax=Leptospira soteropolitanensis TaxID=2950025 RepID=A0AAW5VBC3_9LEPT|nr:hydrolase, carbon-nitrogen family protein [Leptospira soteropolitanensis]MCW7491365.1 hydrolase, carbon-nitrogen family protein [Leptospira soteropolitanensis]MCW7498950.1 hydrolase, carbon-nitrogen family protein [Leptospira soteropolitanensis]MCW7521458.1 hydrolase, carbon-nitrogen family protein [Leptospira soteropolitanensis]MCW7525053.1 hydrolase, carbon-nitrogen family protein [Leptospira soteropolitanensis]MCW7528921.1 hydrolase, carbon-nitrogen family protein [Leptospira soteropolit